MNKAFNRSFKMMRLLPLSFLPSSQVSIEYFLAEFPSFCARCCPLDIVTGPLPLLLNEQLSLQRVSGLMHRNRLMSVSWITRQENNVDRSFKIHLQLPLNSFQKQLSTEIFQSINFLFCFTQGWNWYESKVGFSTYIKPQFLFQFLWWTGSLFLSTL